MGLSISKSAFLPTIKQPQMYYRILILPKFHKIICIINVIWKPFFAKLLFQFLSMIQFERYCIAHADRILFTFLLQLYKYTRHGTRLSDTTKMCVYIMLKHQSALLFTDISLRGFHNKRNNHTFFHPFTYSISPIYLFYWKTHKLEVLVPMGNKRWKAPPKNGPWEPRRLLAPLLDKLFIG